MDSKTFRRIRLGFGLTGGEFGCKLMVSGTCFRMLETGKKPVSELMEIKIKEEKLSAALQSDDPFFELIREMLPPGPDSAEAVGDTTADKTEETA